jgi:hypothetical protein
MPRTPAAQTTFSLAEKRASYGYAFGSDDELIAHTRLPVTANGTELAVNLTYEGRIGNVNMIGGQAVDYNTKFLFAPLGENDPAVRGVIHVHFYVGSRKIATVRWKAHDGDEQTSLNIVRHYPASTADTPTKRNMALNLGDLKRYLLEGGSFPLHLSLLDKLQQCVAALGGDGELR